MTLEQILTLAQLRNCNTSSALCLSDAFSLLDKGDHGWAKRRALDSLAHSVGKFSPEFVAASVEG